MGRRTISSETWTEIVGRDLVGTYSIVVEDAPIYLSPGERPETAPAGLPIRQGSIQSIEIDRLDKVYARPQDEQDATVRVVPDLSIEGSNERNVAVQASVDSGRYPEGDSFDTGSGDSFPIDFDPAAVVKTINLTIVEGEVEIEVTTSANETVTLPVDSKTSLTDYVIDSFKISDPNGTAPRVAGGWAGE